MIPTRQVDRETHIAEILLKSEAALGELHQYYKFGRHDGTFPEKPYFLLSHCAHLLFSLWLTESESPAGLFEYSSRLNAMISSLDFDALRYADYKRRAFHADAYQEHLKNEPKWFKFWLAALEKQDETRPLSSQEFSQSILTYVSHPGFLEGKISKKHRKTLADLLKTDTVDRIFSRSISLLEEMTAAIVFRFTTLDQRHHTREQLASLICLLRQVRRTIISESPAQGPYVLLSNKNWGIPSSLFRMYGGRMRGTLKVVLKRDGGHIVCSYSWTSGARSKCRSWTRDASALTHLYEEELFKTWSYDTGEPLHAPASSTDTKAYWLVQSNEAKRLRAVFRHIETVMKALAVNPLCNGLIADIARLSMDNQTNWQGTRLAWTYVNKLDHVLDTLKFAYREASVLGGDNPGAEVISNMWPPQPSVCERAERHEWHVTEPAELTEETEEVAGDFDGEAEGRQARDERPAAVEQAKCSGRSLAQDEISDDPEEQQEPPIAAQCPAHESEQESESQATCCPIPTPTESAAEDLICPKPEIRTDQVSYTDETEEMPGRLDDEAEERQVPEEQPDAVEQAEYGSTSLPGDEISDTEQEQGQPIAAQCPASEADPEAESQEACCQIPAPTESAAEELIAPEPEAQTNPVSSTEEVDSSSHDVLAIAVSDRRFCEYIAQQPQREPEAVQAPSEAEPTTDANPPEPCPSEPTHDYQAYFARLAKQGVAPSVASAVNSRYPKRPSLVKRAKSKITPEQMEAVRQLLHKLLEHHAPHTELPRETPLSLRTLQQTLGWKQSDVQRAMTNLFGQRPFTAYKHKCSQSVIGEFLEDCRHQYLDGADSQHDANPRQTLQTV